MDYITENRLPISMSQGYPGDEVECGVDAGGGEGSRLVPGAQEEHQYQTETKELVHYTKPGEEGLVSI